MSMKFLKTAASYWKKVSGNVVVKDTAASVGIGTDDPYRVLEVVGGANAAETVLLQLRSDYTTANTGSTIRFVNSTAGDAVSGVAEVAALRQSLNAGDLVFRTATGAGSITEKMRIDSETDVTVSIGNLVIGTAGKGIDFSAQTSTTATGAAATAELLDHYEEGTWTPTFTGVTSITYTAQTGFYTRVGDMVYVQFYFLGNWTASGTLVLHGLPFTVGLSSGATINIGYQTFEAVAPIGYCGVGLTQANFNEMGTTGTAWAPPTGTGKYLIGSGVYKTTT